MEKLKIQEVFDSLHSSLKGLSEEEAIRRLKIYGYNEIEPEEFNIVKHLIKILLNPVNLMILSAALISFYIHHIEDFYLILFLFALNVAITFLQEFKSEKYLKKLKEKLDMKVKVKRNGAWKEISSRLIVPGDIIYISSGSVVPADIKVVESKNLLVDESAITGESLPKEKEEGDVLYASSIIKRGEGIGVVVATGVHTKYGKLINLIQKTKGKSDLEKAILKVGASLIVFSVILIVALTLKLLYLNWNIYDILVYDLTLLVASIPSALPTVIATILLVSSYVLAKKDILVRRLSSPFDIAQMNLLATDKTGTLTENRIKLEKIVPINSSEEEVLLYAYLASDPRSTDPIDTAVSLKFEEENLKVQEEIEIKEFVPYDSVRKYSEAKVIIKGKVHTVRKGSAEKLLKIVKDGGKHKKLLERLYEEGYRVLAVTFDDKLVGFLCFYDPPRKDAKEVIEELRKLGIRVKMITGDSKRIAVKVGKEVGINGLAISREEMYKILTHQHFKFIAEKYDIFAEVYPEDKYKLVETFRRLGYKVGVTGDGVNDIGAFKVSNVGIAVYNAVQAAKEFADLILTAPGLRQLVDAIKRSREAFTRIENYIIYRISENIRFPFFIVLAFLFFSFKLSPIFMLLLTILNDIPIMAISFDDVKYSNSPSHLNLKKLIAISIVLGFIGSLGSLLYLRIMLNMVSVKLLEVLLFLKLLLTGHFLLFVVRTRDEFWFRNPPRGILLHATLGTQILGTLVALAILLDHLSLNYSLFLISFTWIYALVWLHINDLFKIILFRLRKI